MDMVLETRTERDNNYGLHRTKTNDRRFEFGTEWFTAIIFI